MSRYLSIVLVVTLSAARARPDLEETFKSLSTEPWLKRELAKNAATKTPVAERDNITGERLSRKLLLENFR